MAASSEQQDAAQKDAAGGLRRRVGIVACDPLRIVGLHSILNSGDDGHQLQTDIVELSPASLRDANGIAVVFIDSEAAPQLFELLGAFQRARPDLRLIVLGSETGFDFIERIIAAGAKGYLAYTATAAELRMAISIVEDGSVWAPRKVMARLVSAANERIQQASAPRLEWTARETEVLDLLLEGRTNREIGTALGIDEGTVKAHMGRLMRKVGVTNRTALTMHALKPLTRPKGSG